MEGKKLFAQDYVPPKILNHWIVKHILFFPTIDSNNKLRLLKGTKCPLTDKEFVEHPIWVLYTWSELLENEKIKIFPITLGL